MQEVTTMRSRITILTIVLTALLAPTALARTRTVTVSRAAGLTLVGEHPGDLAGASVAGAGDVNGDGRADVIVGAPLADPNGVTDAGSAYVVFGGCAAGSVQLASLGACGFRIDGSVPLPPFTRHKGSNPLTSGAGAVVAGVGDVNGDGLADVVVSGRETTPFGGAPNVVYVVFGKRGTEPVNLGGLGAGGFVIRSGIDGLTVVDGHAVGDVNGDGRADVAVRTSIDGDEDAGSLQIVFGRTDTTAVALGPNGVPGTSFMVAGGFAGMELGQGIAAAGDINHDGFGDVLIGAPGVSSRQLSDERGAVFVLYGRATQADVRIRPRVRFDGYAINGPRALEGFGYSVAPLAGSGLLAGAPGALSQGFRGRGGAWILTSRTARARHVAGPPDGGPAGVIVAAPGDLTGDRKGDVLVLARGRRDRAAGAWLYSLRARLEITYKGLRNATEARISGAPAGDIVGSSRPDVIFGSPGANRAYVVQ
jgi:hypothetical protein